MGRLFHFNDKCIKIASLKEQHGLNVFVETGCFRGDSLSYVNALNWDKMFSCDIDLDCINACKDISPNLFLYHGTSIKFLEDVVPALSENDRVFFYLDAHLPGMDLGRPFNPNDPLNFPLHEELAIIHKYREDKDDVILCDDLRIYEDGPFESGNWGDRHQIPGLNLDFLLQYNYKVTKFYSDEGYFLLTR